MEQNKPLKKEQLFRLFTNALVEKNRADDICRDIIESVNSVLDSKYSRDLFTKLCAPHSKKWIEPGTEVVKFLDENGKTWFKATVKHEGTFEPFTSVFAISYDALINKEDYLLCAEFVKSNIMITIKSIYDYENELNILLKNIEDNPHFGYESIAKSNELRQIKYKLAILKQNLFVDIMQDITIYKPEGE